MMIVMEQRQENIVVDTPAHLKVQHERSPVSSSSTSPVSSDDEMSSNVSIVSHLSEDASLEPSPQHSTAVSHSLMTSDFPEMSDKTFGQLRWSYLCVMLVIMLADGLQGTHLYVLYESYGYSVASLYCLGFLAGGFFSPITGPLIDKIGRKRAAILYCLLEIFINRLEQYPYLVGLIVSRVIGGFTTNLLSSVFEAWLDTEYRHRGLAKEKYEIIMRDSVIISNLAAIFSGYLAHVLAETYGNVGPFHGAVTCTTLALGVVVFVWNENYGTSDSESAESMNMCAFMKEALDGFKSDSKMLRIGIIQGLTTGSVHTFIFLWAPYLRELALNASKNTLGLDSSGEPAYGLIFGAFMAAGVLGGLLAPKVRAFISLILSPSDNEGVVEVEVEGEEKISVRPMAVEFLAAFCYLVSAAVFVVPLLLSTVPHMAFSGTLAAFVLYELLIGIFFPCEGVIRSLYFPANARGSVMVLPRIVVNVVVSIGVYSNNFISFQTASLGVGCLMLVATVLQLSLISSRDWRSLRESLFSMKTSKSLRMDVDESFECTEVSSISSTESCSAHQRKVKAE